MPVLALHLGASGYGALGALTAFQTLLTQLFGLGLGGAPVRYYSLLAGVERRDFLGSLFFGGTGLTAVLTTALHFACPVALDVLGLSGAYTSPLQLTLWTAFLQAGARTIPLGVLRAQSRGGPYLALSILSITSTTALVVWHLVFGTGGLLGATIGFFGGALVTFIASALTLLPDAGLRVRPRQLLEGLNYGGPLIPHNIAHWVLGLSDRLLIGRLLGAGPLGVYHFAYQFASIFLLLTSSINSAILPSFAGIEGSFNRERKLARLRASIAGYFGAIAVLGLGIAILVPRGVTSWLPIDYRPSAPLIPWLTGSVAFFAAYSVPMNVLTISLGQTKGIAPISLAAGAINVALNLALLEVIGLWAAVLATAVSYAVLWLGIRYRLRRTQAADLVLVNTRQVSAMLATTVPLVVLSQLVYLDSPLGDLAIGGGLWAIGAIIVWKTFSRAR